MTLTIEAVLKDSTGRRFNPEADRHGPGVEAALRILGRADIRDRLRQSERLGHPALAGAAEQLEADATIRAVLEEAEGGHSFRKLVGVLVRMTMEQMGWEKDGTRRGPVPTSAYFTSAQRYVEPTASSARERGLAVLDRIEAMAVEGERDDDGSELLAALAVNRAAEGRTLQS